MSYANVDEVWGPSFTKKKRSKKEKRLETQEKKMLQEAVDTEIIIPRVDDSKQARLADSRQTLSPSTLPRDQLDSFQGYDRYSDKYGSPYQPNQPPSGASGVPDGGIHDRGHYQPRQPRQPSQPRQVQLTTQLGATASQELQKMIQLPEETYNQLVTQVEGFANQGGDQFNQLLLYIFTGVFYLFLMDMMYQLGKKSY